MIKIRLVICHCFTLALPLPCCVLCPLRILPDLSALYNNLSVAGLKLDSFHYATILLQVLSTVFKALFLKQFYYIRVFYRPSQVSFMPRTLQKEHPRHHSNPSPLLSSNWSSVVAAPPFDFICIAFGSFIDLRRSLGRNCLLQPRSHSTLYDWRITQIGIVKNFKVWIE